MPHLKFIKLFRLRQERQRFYLVLCLCFSVLLLLLLHLWRLPRSVTIGVSPNSLDQLSTKIARQLRTDQRDLASIGQYIYSAYYDTRTTLGDRKLVRVISVLDTQAYTASFICQFLHASGDLSYSTLARKSKIGAGMSYGTHYYQEFVLSCQIANDLRTATYLVLQSDDGTFRSQVIKVRHNPLSRGEKPAYPKLIINCVSVTYGRPSQHRLIEWLEAQRLLKMEKVQLHFYHMMNKEYESVAQAYSAEGLLDVRRIGCPFCDPGQEENLGMLLMSPAINQCLYENLGRYKFTAVFDLDEIVVPLKQPDYPSLLASLEKQANSSSYAFSNWYHFSELGEDVSVPKDLYMLRHPFRVKEASPQGYSTKSIHRSDCVVALHNHFSWEDAPNPGTQMKSYFVPTDVALNEHYKKCHFDQNKCQAMTQVDTRTDGSRLNRLIGQELASAYQQVAKRLLRNNSAET